MFLGGYLWYGHCKCTLGYVDAVYAIIVGEAEPWGKK